MLTWDDDQTTAELQLRLQPATAMPTPAIAEVAIAKPAGTKPYSEVRDSLHAEVMDKALKKAFAEEADRLRAQAKGDATAMVVGRQRRATAHG